MDCCRTQTFEEMFLHSSRRVFTPPRATRPFFVGLLAGALALTGAAAHALPVGHDFHFSVSNASMWGSGSGNSISLEKYWGFEKHASIGPDFGPLALKLHTDVKAGVELSFLATSGKVDIDYPTHVVVDVPATAHRGNSFTIGSSWSAGDAVMKTFSPQVDFGLDFPLSIKGDLRAEAFGWKGSLWRPSASATYELPIIDNHRLKYSLHSDIVNVDLKAPIVNTTGHLQNDNRLSSSGSDTFATVETDIDAIFTALTGIPLGFDKTINLGLAKAHVYADLLDLDLVLEAALRQKFVFDPGFKVLYRLETGEELVADVNAPISFVVPTVGDFGNTFDISATYFLDAMLENDTALDLDLNLDLSMLEAGGEAYVRWIKCKWWKCSKSWKRVASGHVGPAVDASWRLIDGEIGLFDERFDVTGFSSFTTQYSIALVNEPHPLPLLVFGLGLLLFRPRSRLTSSN